MQKIFQLFQVIWFLLVVTSGCSGSSQAEQAELTNNATKPSSPVLHTFTVTPAKPDPHDTLTPTIALTNTPEPPGKTVIAFTGVIVPARCVQEEISKQGSADYIYSEVREILVEADIAVGVYNATMRDGVEYMGCVKSWELVGSTNNADALASAGFDVMSVATNHIKDCGFSYCGDEGFFSTLENLSRVNIQTVGAGATLEAGLNPIVIEANGIRFGFVSLGEVNERVFADVSIPGIAYLSNRNLEMAIASAKEVADVVIVLPHSGPEDYPEVTPQQKYWARYSVLYGADLVVMNHAHILQGYQTIDGVPVFYSLGNFVFDQSWARDHQQAAILLVEFTGSQFTSFTMIPTVVDQNGTVHFAGDSEGAEILEWVESLSEELSTWK